MLSTAHHAPLEVLRKEPALVPALLREALGLVLPAFAAASLTDTDFTQARPAQARPAAFHADLAVALHGGGRDRSPVMGIVVEVQRHRDARKRRSWPLYAAALHARLGGCQTCLVVLTSDERVARWAGAPICTLQPGSPFTPLVIGPDQIPEISPERARREPWRAALFAIVHGARRGSSSAAARAAMVALEELPEHRGMIFDLIHASFDEAAWRALENAMRISMRIGDYELRSTFARRYFGKGLKKGIAEGIERGEVRGLRKAVLELAEERFGLASRLRAVIEACDDAGLLATLVARIGTVPDREAAVGIAREIAGAKPDGAAHPARAHARRAGAARTTEPAVDRVARPARKASARGTRTLAERTGQAGATRTRAARAMRATTGAARTARR